MGYSYDAKTGQLCCDICGNHGKVKRVKCPVNWCQAIAMCPDCRKQKRLPADYHKDCAKHSAEFHATEKRRADLLASGAAVRCAALCVGERVHVLFRRIPGPNIGFYMAPGTYDAIPLLTPATPDDYRAFGTLEPAPADFRP